MLISFTLFDLLLLKLNPKAYNPILIYDRIFSTFFLLVSKLNICIDLNAPRRMMCDATFPGVCAIFRPHTHVYAYERMAHVGS